MKMKSLPINIQGIEFNYKRFLQSINSQKKTQESSNVLRKEVIKLMISEEGNKFYDYQKNDNNPKIFDDILKVLEDAIEDPIAAYQDYIDETIYGKAIALKEGTKKIMSMSLTDEEKKEKISILNNQYERTIKSASQNISLKLDSYFEAGTFLMDRYSEEPVEEIFNETIFENHFKYLSLSAKKNVFNIEGSSDLPSTKKVMENKSSEKNVLEKMSMNDMKEIIRFIYQVGEIESIDSSSEDSIGERVANREIVRLEFIDKLNINQSTKAGMIASEKRQSNGLIRHYSYEEIMKQNKTRLGEYLKYLKTLTQRLKRIQERISEVEELFGTSSKNDMLLNLLTLEENIKKRLSKITDKKNIAEENNQLKGDKSGIVKKRIYNENVDIYNNVIDSLINL